MTGHTMSGHERRQSANAALREKITQIQTANQSLKDSVDRIESQAIRWAREHGTTKVPDARQELQKVQALLRDQKQAFEHTQRALLGETLTTTPTKAHVPIISPEEMAALMRGV
jgi:hypothetical protein